MLFKVKENLSVFKLKSTESDNKAETMLDLELGLHVAIFIKCKTLLGPDCVYLLL